MGKGYVGKIIACLRKQARTQGAAKESGSPQLENFSKKMYFFPFLEGSPLIFPSNYPKKFLHSLRAQ